MKLFVTGTRGIPNIPGGVERHCEQLYPRIVEMGVDVKLSRRSSYVEESLNEWRGIKLIDLFSPHKKSMEAIIHTTLSLIKAKLWGADIVHIHAIGPAIMVPLGRMLGMKVIVTNHGPDYDRQKWGALAKGILHLGEYLGCKYANDVIVISEPIRQIVAKRCKRNSNIIFNGVPIPKILSNTQYLELLDIIKDHYILAVARLVPEKGLHDLIDAFEGMDTDFKLVIAGDADHTNSYSMELKKRAAANDNIIMPGYVTGGDLSQLYTHARLFVLPSYHEGLPIALLEALSFGLQVVISDIPANKEVKLDSACYFHTGNVTELGKRIQKAIDIDWSDSKREEIRAWVEKYYNWNDIANQTLAVYKKALSK